LTSSLIRQFDTAKIIANTIVYPVEKNVVTDLLLERAGGSFEGKFQEEFFNASEDEQIAAGAESLKQLSERALELIKFTKNEYPSDTVLLVGSAAIGEMLRAMIKHNDYTKMFDDGPLPNSELIQLI
jgi:broad specificity phosphatase PhoE